jgi:two-component system nitrogen regulation response regulator GlnG
MRPARGAGSPSGVHSSPLSGAGESARIDAVDNTAATTSSAEVTRPTILVVDDDEDARAALATILAAEGFQAVTAADGESAIERVASEPPAVVLLDRIMPGLDGIETLRRLKAIAPEVTVIIVTGYGDTSSAVQAMKLGAYDYLTKPLQIDQLLIAVRRAVERRELGAEIEGLRNQLDEARSLRSLMGPSREVENILRQIRQVADSDFTILIHGETGTGKELVARAIHQLSFRRTRPFVALDCGGIPETLIESELFGYEKGAFTGASQRKDGYFQFAEGGSLFFDEITNLPLTTQAKLLRVLQERQVRPLGGSRTVPVNVRVLAAYNVPLVDEIRAGRFRQDLYYRLNEFVMIVPPLRARPHDIPYLAKRFLTEASMELRRPVVDIHDEALEILVRHSWPGNVRELRNVIRRAVLLASGLIRPEHLRGLTSESPQAPSAPPASMPPTGRSLKAIAETAVAEAESLAIRQALHMAGGKRSAAARLLQIDSKTLYVKMKRYRILGRDFVG